MNTPKLAVIIPCFNEELCIKTTVKRLFEVFDDLIIKNKITPDSYLYLVDDGSSDSTWQIVSELHAGDNRVKGMKFIRNYGNQKALIAGLEGVHRLGCDCVVSIDADLQQDENSIEKFIDKYMEGYDVVAGIRNDRKALFLRGFFNEVGLKTAYVKFDVKPRMAGESKFNFMSLMTLALNGITSFSIVPLRFIAVLGFLMALFGFCAGLEVVFEKLMYNDSPNGMATTIILLCVFGGTQLFCLGIIGEYIGQVYREVKARPRYIKEIELL